METIQEGLELVLKLLVFLEEFRDKPNRGHPEHDLGQ